MDITSEQPMNSQEAAEYVGLAVSTMRRYRASGTGPAFYKVGQRVYYDTAQLDAWASRREVNPVRAISEERGQLLSSAYKEQWDALRTRLEHFMAEFAQIDEQFAALELRHRLTEVVLSKVVVD